MIIVYIFLSPCSLFCVFDSPPVNLIALCQHNGIFQDKGIFSHSFHTVKLASVNTVWDFRTHNMFFDSMMHNISKRKSENNYNDTTENL